MTSSNQPGGEDVVGEEAGGEVGAEKEGVEKDQSLNSQSEGRIVAKNQPPCILEVPPPKATAMEKYPTLRGRS